MSQSKGKKNSTFFRRAANFCTEQFNRLQLVAPSEMEPTQGGEFLNASSPDNRAYAHSLQQRYGRRGNAEPINLMNQSQIACERFSLARIEGNNNRAGSFGRVWLGIDKRDRKYALKSISPRFTDAMYQKLIHMRHCQREIYFLSNIRHPNVVKIFQAETIGANHVVLKTEFLPTEMHEVCANPWQEMFNVRRFVQQIGSALCYLHQNCVAHHDLKVHNVMLNRLIDSFALNQEQIESEISKAKFKLIDFGLAKKYESSESIDREWNAGTNFYKCLEKAIKPLRFNPYQSDAFSFGVCLLITLVGRVRLETRVSYEEQCVETRENFFTKGGNIKMQEFARVLLFDDLGISEADLRVEEQTAYALLDREAETDSRPARITIAQAMEKLPEIACESFLC